MTNEIPVPIVGNLTKAPELRYRPGGGEAVLRFTIASTPRYYSKAEQAYVDGTTTFMPCVMDSKTGERGNDYLQRLARTFDQGDHVLAFGDLQTRTKEEAGQTQRWVELRVRELGASPRFKDLTIHREK